MRVKEWVIDRRLALARLENRKMLDTKDIVMYSVVIGVVAIIAFIVYMAATSPSCEELGGKTEFSHFLPIYNSTLKTTQLIPIYECVKE